MLQQANLRIVDDESSEPTSTTDIQQPQAPQHYARADEFALEDYSYPVPGFVNELLAELEKDFAPEDAKLIDTIEPSKDIDDGLLVAFPDESLLFLGEDPTTKDAMPWYGFTVEPFEPIPAPETAQDALDLLKPPDVKDAVADGWIPDRHGEWWLLPTEMIPLGEIHKPGVKTEPYGPSPLGNHVPREYGFTEPNGVFMNKFHEQVENAPTSIKTVPEAIEWSFRQQKKQSPPEYIPSWADIREWAGEILVKGTIRHRENDHYVIDCGNKWHKAVTHRVEVYTADALGEGVHLDYYGQ